MIIREDLGFRKADPCTLPLDRPAFSEIFIGTHTAEKEKEDWENWEDLSAFY